MADDTSEVSRSAGGNVAGLAVGDDRVRHHRLHVGVRHRPLRRARRAGARHPGGSGGTRRPRGQAGGRIRARIPAGHRSRGRWSPGTRGATDTTRPSRRRARSPPRRTATPLRGDLRRYRPTVVLRDGRRRSPARSSSGGGVLAYRMATVLALRRRPRLRAGAERPLRRRGLADRGTDTIGMVPARRGRHQWDRDRARRARTGRGVGPVPRTRRRRVVGPRHRPAGGLLAAAPGGDHRRRRRRPRSPADRCPDPWQAERRDRSSVRSFVVGVATLAWNRWTGLVFSDRRTANTDSWIVGPRSVAAWHADEGPPGGRRRSDGTSSTPHSSLNWSGWRP